MQKDYSSMFEGFDNMELGQRQSAIKAIAKKTKLSEKTITQFYYEWKQSIMPGAKCTPKKTLSLEDKTEPVTEPKMSFIDAILKDEEKKKIKVNAEKIITVMADQQKGEDELVKTTKNEVNTENIDLKIIEGFIASTEQHFKGEFGNYTAKVDGLKLENEGFEIHFQDKETWEGFKAEMDAAFEYSKNVMKMKGV